MARAGGAGSGEPFSSSVSKLQRKLADFIRVLLQYSWACLGSLVREDVTVKWTRQNKLINTEKPTQTASNNGRKRQLHVLLNVEKGSHFLTVTFHPFITRKTIGIHIWL